MKCVVWSKLPTFEFVLRYLFSFEAMPNSAQRPPQLSVGGKGDMGPSMFEGPFGTGGQTLISSMQCVICLRAFSLLALCPVPCFCPVSR